MTAEQKFDLLQKTQPGRSLDDTILAAALSVLVMFPGCEDWEREGNMVFAPDTGEGIYLPIEDLKKVEAWAKSLE